jgi:hypothetical protein
MTEYQHLNADELLHVAMESEQLTDEARMALDVELRTRGISAADIDSYRADYVAADEAEKLRAARRIAGAPYRSNKGFGTKFLGKTHRSRDPLAKFEEYDTTLWFVVFWFPVFPIASFTVRRSLKRWLGITFASDENPLQRHPRDWNQILLTWVKASAILLALRLTYLILLHFGR